jgi:UDP-N-acetylglucosamine 4-epimerase
MTERATVYRETRERLRASPRRWLVTGAAGFIGSHLVEHLLRLDQRVTAIDNFATGRPENLEAIRAAVSREQASRLEFLQADIRDPAACRRACAGVDVVLHQAALGSVPRSVAEPALTHDVNVTGFLNVLEAARAAGTRRIVYASSSSVYGDDPGLPKVEGQLGRVLSPYAASKLADEIYAHAYGRCYGLELVGLRYFNVFGPRQDPGGPYAAVIPLWFSGLLRGDPVVIFGDGETSRDFCFVENVVQANLLAATTTRGDAVGEVYNVACGERTTLNELFRLVRMRVARVAPAAASREPVYRPFRAGDIRHSLADTAKAHTRLDYEPMHLLAEGLDRATDWYVATASR